MPTKYVCKFTKEELEKYYLLEKRTLKEMCEILNVKSDITVRKVLHSYGISTNNNERIAEHNRNGLSKEEFKKRLYELYIIEEKSINEIAKIIGITSSGIRKNLIRYNIKLRNHKESCNLYSTKLFTENTRN